MATVLTNSGALPFAPTAKAAPAAKAKTPFLKRLFNNMIESRQRAADRVIAQYLALHGDKFTDDAERQIERLMYREGGSR